MAVIWGLDLKEMKWKAFSSKNMFSKVYHLRREKMIIYQIAMILCVVSESVGTSCLAKYVDQQDFIESHYPGAHVHNNDIVGIQSFNIFIGIAVATIFGAAFFFDLFFPERHESRAVKISWKISAVVVSIAAFADAVAYSVIVVNNGVEVDGYSQGINVASVVSGLEGASNPPFRYKKNGRAVASLVLLWIGWVFTVISTIILFKSYAYNEKYGPKERSELDQEKRSFTTSKGSVDPENPPRNPHYWSADF